MTLLEQYVKRAKINRPDWIITEEDLVEINESLRCLGPSSRVGDTLYIEGKLYKTAASLIGHRMFYYWKEVKINYLKRAKL